MSLHCKRVPVQHRQYETGLSLGSITSRCSGGKGTRAPVPKALSVARTIRSSIDLDARDERSEPLRGLRSLIHQEDLHLVVRLKVFRTVKLAAHNFCTV